MSQHIDAEIELLFRRESARLISVLTRILGPQNLELAEDVLQESFIAALDDWSHKGIPDNPSGWLVTAARNRAIDAIRRERTRRTFAPDLAMHLDGEWTLGRTVDEAFEDNWVRDDQLRMIFMCCHPTLAPENRLPLILKTLCGLGVPAIARSLLTTESTINKRLYRTRQALQGVAFALPPPDELPQALETVHTVLYLLFNEGYFSTNEIPIVREMCRDAMSLTQLLADEPELSNGDTLALLALMHFATARFDSRIDESGQPVPLDEQDRSRWNRDMIERGLAILGESTRRGVGPASRYHIEAAIAARHCTARTFEATDWHSICKLYDRLLDVYPSALTRLNRAVAISYRSGPAEAIALVEALRDTGELPHSNVIAAVLANLYRRAGDDARADAFRDAALAQATTPHERRMIR
ncbi:MAG: sigma-70 family RNA polymerase sigma factor [Myxococcota bacterium]